MCIQYSMTLLKMAQSMFLQDSIKALVAPEMKYRKLTNILHIGGTGLATVKKNTTNCDILYPYLEGKLHIMTFGLGLLLLFSGRPRSQQHRHL